MPSTGRRSTSDPSWRRPMRLALAVVTGSVLLAGCDAHRAYQNTFNLGFPKPITDEGKVVLDLWDGSVAAAAVVGFFVWGLIFWAVVRYRKNSEDLPRQVRYNLPIEVLYTVVPFVIVVVLFYYTAVGENRVDRLTKNPDVTIAVVAFKWNWQFNYTNAGVQVTGSTAQPATLVLPVNKTIRFIETSPDVIHSFFVPAFLFKRDVIPGRANQFEVTVRQTGTYIGHCAEFCGEKHSQMNFHVSVVPDDQYAAYISRLQSDPTAAIGPNSQIATGFDLVHGTPITLGSPS
ncbi:MAG: cytochrome c oxidase subunit II [Actinomycetota bacterium]|nr:cytochrome c oxidase subunit II [Actinomycetota bacterium]